MVISREVRLHPSDQARRYSWPLVFRERAGYCRRFIRGSWCSFQKDDLCPRPFLKGVFGRGANGGQSGTATPVLPFGLHDVTELSSQKPAYICTGRLRLPVKKTDRYTVVGPDWRRIHQDELRLTDAQRTSNLND